MRLGRALFAQGGHSAVHHLCGACAGRPALPCLQGRIGKYVVEAPLVLGHETAGYGLLSCCLVRMWMARRTPSRTLLP